MRPKPYPDPHSYTRGHIKQVEKYFSKNNRGIVGNGRCHDEDG